MRDGCTGRTPHGVRPPADALNPTRRDRHSRIVGYVILAAFSAILYGCGAATAAALIDLFE